MTEEILNITDNQVQDNLLATPHLAAVRSRKNYLFLIPLALGVYFILGFAQLGNNESFREGLLNKVDRRMNKEPNVNINALLSLETFSQNLRDTVYTDKEMYLELRIDEQMLYVHYRDGTMKEYPVSTGNKYLSKSVESRPGLFAIFSKTAVHLSSQFNNAKMYYFMPFNMGVGFHGLEGTGYYSNLGLRPSSHGCIRMRREDAKVVFDKCEIGTLVLSHRGKSARVVAFTPDGFKNRREYTKEEVMGLLAYNLNIIYEGKYFTTEPKKFVIDGKLVPRIGFNVGNADDIPEKQKFPIVINVFDLLTDKFLSDGDVKVSETLEPELAQYFEFIETDEYYKVNEIEVNTEVVKKLSYNPGGILPYYGPKR